MSYALTFEVTDEHVALLRHAYVGWDGCEFGAPAIDCKRPYGNGDVYRDMAKILGVEIPEDDWDSLPDETIARFDHLHQETATVLQIALRTGVLRAGTYARTNRYGVDWTALSAPVTREDQT